MGTYTANVQANLENYPALNAKIRIIIEFKVIIDSDCLRTVLYPIKLEPAYYMDGQDPTAV